MRSGNRKTLRFVDLFCGIGGFRFAAAQAAGKLGLTPICVMASDIDVACADAYEANFGERPRGDIREIDADEISKHDLLLAGFPCQPFSIMGNGHGFRDMTQGTLFFDIVRILQAKMPRAVVLENVKQLVGHGNGRTMSVIVGSLRELGYSVHYAVLNALDFGLPQKRERVFIVGLLGPSLFEFPETSLPMKPLEDVLEPDSVVDRRFWASDYIRNKRRRTHQAKAKPSIWHENKAGHISSYPYSCALRANASHNYLLVDGKRRLTPREMLRLQGFPEDFKIVCTARQTRTQAGNALPVPVAKAVILSALRAQGYDSRVSAEMAIER